MSKFYETDSEPRWWAGIAGRIILAVILLAAVGLLIGGISYLTADTRGKIAVREKTRANGDYRIAAYEQFYDLCAAVQAKEQAIQNVEADHTAPDVQRSANLIALRNSRAELITQYNANARKADTRGHFLASDLPYTLDQNSEHTTCTS